MKNKVARPINDLLDEFEKYLTAADINTARILAEISTAIVKKRIEMGMSQKEFAKFMGVSQSMVSKWESEDYNYTIASVVEIFDKLGLEFDVVIGETDALYSQEKFDYEIMPMSSNMVNDDLSLLQIA